MSSIDAAIIKALVEHIGGNPDEIPDGTIGGGGSSTLSFRYEPLTIENLTYTKDGSSYCLNKVLPSMFVIGQTVIRLKRTNSDIIDTYICVRHNLRDNSSFYIYFAPIVNDNPFQTSSDESEHISIMLNNFGDDGYMIAFYLENHHEQPSDATATGFYQLVVEGESDNERVLRANFVNTQLTINAIICAIMACMRASNVDTTKFDSI